jgi:hypothetical protein
MPADLAGQLRVLGTAALGSVWFDPKLLSRESNELRGHLLPVCEDRRQMARELAHVARENNLTLRIQCVCGLHPG